jgi:hypothetical protein
MASQLFREGRHLMDPAQLTEILETLLEKGFAPPIFLAGIAVNGEMFLGEYRESPSGSGLDFELLAQHSPDHAFLTPMNMMFVDRRGEAARVVIRRDGDKPKFFLS